MSEAKANQAMALTPPGAVGAKDPPRSESGTISGAPVDIRLSFQLFRRRLFFTVIAGAERRSLERVREERHKHPLATLANLCAIAFGLLFIIPALIGLAHMVLGSLGGL